MNEFVKFECGCDIGYDKGALKKTIENNIFTIFGNITQKNSIVIRYHGLLTENKISNSAEFNMFYFFDELKNDKKIIKLDKCTKCSGECFCTSIDLDIYHTIHFGFFNENNEYELEEEKTFNLNIAPDPISNIMQRYGFEQNTCLPLCEENNDKIFVFKTVLNTIKNLFNKIFNKTISI